MKLTITLDVPESLALELVPEGSLETYGGGGVKVRLRGRLAAVAMGHPPRDVDVLAGRTIDAKLTRELTLAEGRVKLDAEYFDEEFS